MIVFLLCESFTLGVYIVGLEKIIFPLTVLYPFKAGAGATVSSTGGSSSSNPNSELTSFASFASSSSFCSF
jgi:hypothetical protein